MTTATPNPASAAARQPAAMMDAIRTGSLLLDGMFGSPVDEALDALQQAAWRAHQRFAEQLARFNRVFAGLATDVRQSMDALFDDLGQAADSLPAPAPAALASPEVAADIAAFSGLPVAKDAVDAYLAEAGPDPGLDGHGDLRISPEEEADDRPRCGNCGAEARGEVQDADAPILCTPCGLLIAEEEITRAANAPLSPREADAVSEVVAREADAADNAFLNARAPVGKEAQAAPAPKKTKKRRGK